MTLAEQYLIDEKGRKKAVVLPLKRYKQLLEDLHDLAVIAERRDEETIPHADFKRVAR